MGIRSQMSESASPPDKPIKVRRLDETETKGKSEKKGDHLNIYGIKKPIGEHA